MRMVYKFCNLFSLQIWELGEHGDPMFDQGLQFWQTGGGEGGDWVRQVKTTTLFSAPSVVTFLNCKTFCSKPAPPVINFSNFWRFEGGRFLYKLHRSPMCEYMINFILKLKHLPEKYMMNSVLENFTILQVGKNYLMGRFSEWHHQPRKACENFTKLRWGLSISIYSKKDSKKTF